MDAKVHWYRVDCTCVAGGGLWLTEGQILRAEELGDHLLLLLARGAVVPVPARARAPKPRAAIQAKTKTFSLR